MSFATPAVRFPSQIAAESQTQPQDLINQEKLGTGSIHEETKSDIRAKDTLTTSAWNLKEALNAPAWDRALSPDEAWRMERAAQPWRNFPPPTATVIGALISAGPALLLAGFSLWRVRQKVGLQNIDVLICLFGVCILIVAYLPQALLLALSHLIPIYPMNLEEVRTVSLFAIPLLYFIGRALELETTLSSDRVRLLLTITILCVFFLQPITILKRLPETVRVSTIELAQKLSVLGPDASQQTQYARSILGLERQGVRFYYDLTPLSEWLAHHADKSDTILTTRDELYLLDARVLGTSNGFLGTSSASLRRIAWIAIGEQLSEIFGAHDLPGLIRLANDTGAAFAVVPWVEPTAAFVANGYSVIDFRVSKSPYSGDTN